MDPLTIPPRPAPSTAEQAVKDPSASNKPPQSEPQEESFISEVFKFSILALVIVIPFRIYIAQPFIVSGASMSPTFETGQYLIIDQLTYRLEEPERGDVIIFKYPNDPSKYFIKRIIGLPGESIKMANGITSVTTVSGDTMQTLEEPYLRTDRTDDHLSITLSSDEYFVMGDNRSASSDSRVWGPVPRENIVGRALLRLLPPRTFGVLPGVYHFDTLDDTASASE